jgi:tRNA modification GTPase
MSDTVFALATAPGRAAVAVIRMSGPAARSALETLAGGEVRPRRASVRRLTGPAGETIDQAVVLLFPGPRSYTGEDCAELQLHSSAAVIDQCTEVLLGMGLRLAEPGEFTRRAFENGRLDLDQAEAVADLVEAETAAQARQAIGQLEGRLGARYRNWRERLVEALARLEAAVDFPDEEVPTDVAASAREALEALLADIDLALADTGRGQRVRAGYRVAVAGPPNAGKSSLINALARRDVAIVTATPGTTRDIIETPLELDGFKVLLADTAGLRETCEPVEVEGVRRARAWAESADLRLWVVDRSASGSSWAEASAGARPGDLVVLNKADLPEGPDGAAAAQAAAGAERETLTVSVRAGGAEAVRQWLTIRVRRDLAGAEFPAATHERHAASLADAQAHLARALEGLGEPELAAEDVRLAGRALGRISGRIGAEDVLEKVFATFCIGK